MLAENVTGNKITPKLLSLDVMNRLYPEEILLTIADEKILRPKANEININTITCVNLNCQTINGGSATGQFVTATGVQTLSNKSMIDQSTFIINWQAPTTQMGFSVTGSVNTLGILQTSMPFGGVTRVWTIRDVGQNADVVLTEGNQTINGVKTFTALSVAGSAMDYITAITSVGTQVNTLKISRVQPAVGGVVGHIMATTTNTSMIVVPTGSGFFGLALPDATVSGGNARGANSIDLQTIRSAATQVASGSNSVILGNGCTAAGARSMAFGTNSTAINAGSTVFSDSTSAMSDTVANQFVAGYDGGFRLQGGPVTLNHFSSTSSGLLGVTNNATPTSFNVGTILDNSCTLATVEIIGSCSAGTMWLRSRVKINIQTSVSTLGAIFDSWTISDVAGVSMVIAMTGTTLRVVITGPTTTTRWNYKFETLAVGR